MSTTLNTRKSPGTLGAGAIQSDRNVGLWGGAAPLARRQAGGGVTVWIGTLLGSAEAGSATGMPLMAAHAWRT